MAGRWFRFYDAALDDPKVQRLPDNAFRAWVNLMCLASRNDGKISKSYEDLSFSLRKSAGKTKELLTVLIEAGLVDEIENGFEPHNWDVRQYKSDVSTDRVKRFRKRCETVSETPPDTEQIQSRTEQKESTPPRKRASKPPLAEPESFAEFWQAYPNSKARADALKAYRKAIEKNPPEPILAGAKRYAAEMSGEEKKFVKLAGGWLRDERWRDGEEGRVIRLSAFNSPEEQENQRKLMERLNGRQAQN